MLLYVIVCTELCLILCTQHVEWHDDRCSIVALFNLS